MTIMSLHKASSISCIGILHSFGICYKYKNASYLVVTVHEASIYKIVTTLIVIAFCSLGCKYVTTNQNVMTNSSGLNIPTTIRGLDKKEKKPGS